MNIKEYKENWKDFRDEGFESYSNDNQFTVGSYGDGVNMVFLDDGIIVYGEYDGGYGCGQSSMSYTQLEELIRKYKNVI